jgi:hypoxanthine-DNA glycosylase
MPQITRNRTIRPSSRQENSKRYKINTKQVTKSDTLVVNIDHESRPFYETFKFKGADVANKASIHFWVNDNEDPIEINWSCATPTGEKQNTRTKPKETQKQPKPKSSTTPNPDSKNVKQALDPIADSQTEVLILGTLPGDKSLEFGQYYANSSNRFWKIIAGITGDQVPPTYEEKKGLLLRNRIGVWDVAHKANREGSLDTNMKDEEPNNLEGFIKQHKNLKLIGFNGQKPEKLYNKYFSRKKGLKYIPLPSSSGANRGVRFEAKRENWKSLIK